MQKCGAFSLGGWVVDTNFLIAYAERCRSLAENADEFTKRRLLDLAAHYDKRLAGAGPSVDQGYGGNTLDTTAAAPSVALATDSGLAGDGITRIGTVNIAGLEAGATWQYAVNGGSFITGTGASFTLTGDGPKAVLVHQTDAAGNVSADASLNFTLDTTAAAPSVALATDSGLAGDGITRIGTVNVTGLETGATYQYAVNGGAFVTGTGTSFTLTGDGPKAVLVHDSDVAGNVSADASLSFTLDTIAATPAIALGADSGLAGDGITKIGTVDVTGAMDEAPAVIKNIKTDFGAACNGVDSDYAAFQAFNAWALQWQQSHSGLIELDIPSGSICMFSQSGEGSWFAKGIKQLLVKGYGATLSDDNGAGGGFFLGGGGIESGNGGFGYTDSWTARAATVSAGSDFIVLLDPSRASIFSVGTWALITGLDLMGYGSPPNPQFFEYVQITGIDPTTGQVTFAAPLKNSYEINVAELLVWHAGTAARPGRSCDAVRARSLVGHRSRIRRSHH